MENASDRDGGDVDAGSEISLPIPPLPSDRQSSTSHLPSNNFLCHPPPPSLPPFCSSWQFNPSNATASIRSQNDYRDNQRSYHSLTQDSLAHKFQSQSCFHHHSPPVFPPFQKSSIRNDGINPTTTNTNPSSKTPLPPLVPPHQSNRNPPSAAIQPFHLHSRMARTNNSAASTYSRESTLNSSVSSKVNSLAEDESCITPTTKPTIQISHCNKSRDSRESSLTSSHSTIKTSSTVTSSAVSMLRTSYVQHHIPTPNSNLTSYDMVGIMNGKSPDLLYLPNDFLPTNKKN